MKVQTAIFQSEYCTESELFYRSDGLCVPNQNRIIISEGTTISTDTYQNLFDEYTWFGYTGISLWLLKLSVKGNGTVKLIRRCDKNHEILSECATDSNQVQELVLPFRVNGEKGYCYFEIQAAERVEVVDAGYHTNALPKREINLCVLSCTYHRNEEIKKNIRQLLASDFFKEDNQLYHHLRVIVSDNGSELEEIEEDYLKTYHNPNTGGSGGFTRCLQELRRHYEEVNITNVIFMDDDVEFLNESLYRLYALLSYIKVEYEESVIAGRMFRTDQRWIQYTAAEIWNAGDLRHIGLNQDMRALESLAVVNDNANAEYGGWWFCCFPYSFAKENDPLPFFLHCDDVEYGLRHGGTPIILNGIHVWHATYEYRQSPVIAYYDIRNSMIVNAMYGFLNSNEDFRNYSLLKIIDFHQKEEYEKERMAICATKDFIKGYQWFLHVSSEMLHKKIGTIRKSGKYSNYIQQLMLRVRFKKKKQVAENYQNLLGYGGHI